MHDLTDFVTAARTNDPRAVGALSERFSGARFHVPLMSLDGVKNRPEAALELGASLPAHRMRLDTGLVAIPLFTTLDLCRDCAKKLSWKTDRKAIKTLPLPGAVALAYLKGLLLSPDIDRAILNPLSEGALHLARTEVEAIASGQRLRTLWLYGRHGGLNRPVEIEGGSLLSVILSAAGRVVSRGEAPDVETSPGSENLPEAGPHAALAVEIYRLLNADAGEGLEVIVTRLRDGIRIESIPVIDANRLVRAKAIAERHLAGAPEGTRVGLRMDGASVVISSSSSSAPAPPARKEPELGYIPLEPEEESR